MQLQYFKLSWIILNKHEGMQQLNWMTQSHLAQCDIQAVQSVIPRWLITKLKHLAKILNRKATGDCVGV